MILRLKHIKLVRVKGRAYFYHQITKERLPDDREKRAARVLVINSTLKGTTRNMVPGSMADVITKYKRAPEFTDLMPQTRQNYAAVLDVIMGYWGHLPLKDIKRSAILALRDNFSQTPAKANRLVSCLNIVLNFAVDRDLLVANPGINTKKLKMGSGHSAWQT
ncbi:MAG: hypothetical protein IIA65_03280 [Planctomycetes bacterium]|nr:hypothetical protein [Planctomycetota bacterium]